MYTSPGVPCDWVVDIVTSLVVSQAGKFLSYCFLISPYIHIVSGPWSAVGVYIVSGPWSVVGVYIVSGPWSAVGVYIVSGPWSAVGVYI